MHNVVNRPKATKLYFTRVNFMLSELYLSKALVPKVINWIHYV